MRGMKWLNTATYITDADRAKVVARVVEARERLPAKYARTVGVRPPSYTGEPHPIAAITYGPGGCMLHEVVFRNV